jgi:hypothetical protein
LLGWREVALREELSATERLTPGRLLGTGFAPAGVLAWRALAETDLAGQGAPRIRVAVGGRRAG